MTQDELERKEQACCACTRHKQRNEDEQKALKNRLSRIEGQVRGIRRMVEDEVYCVDILNQLIAARSALDAFGRELMAQHVRDCVVTGVKQGDEAVVEELISTLRRMMK